MYVPGHTQLSPLSVLNRILPSLTASTSPFAAWTMLPTLAHRYTLPPTPVQLCGFQARGSAAALSNLAALAGTPLLTLTLKNCARVPAPSIL
jgi:hypothetical protein